MLTKILGGIRIEDSSRFYINSIDGGAVGIYVNLTAGVFFLDENGGDDDLVKMLTSAFDAVITPGKVIWGVSGDGKRVTWRTSSGSVYFFRHTSARYVDDILRFSGVTLQATTTVSEGDRTVYGVFAPTFYLMDDVESVEAYNAQWDEPRGVMGVLSVGGRRDLSVTLRSVGVPHGGDWNEYHELRDLIRVGATGLPLRLYRQADLSGAYNLDSNQMGYVDFILKGSNIPVESLDPAWYKYHDVILKGWLDAVGEGTDGHYF